MRLDGRNGGFQSSIANHGGDDYVNGGKGNDVFDGVGSRMDFKRKVFESVFDISVFALVGDDNKLRLKTFRLLNQQIGIASRGENVGAKEVGMVFYHLESLRSNTSRAAQYGDFFHFLFGVF